MHRLASVTNADVAYSRAKEAAAAQAAAARVSAEHTAHEAERLAKEKEIAAAAQQMLIEAMDGRRLSMKASTVATAPLPPPIPALFSSPPTPTQKPIFVVSPAAPVPATAPSLGPEPGLLDGGGGGGAGPASPGACVC
jgi:hypothetical protein